MKGRPTTDPKQYRVNIRVNKELKDRLFMASKQMGVTIAEYVREIIDNQETVKIVEKCGTEECPLKDKPVKFNGQDILRNKLMQYVNCYHMTYEEFIEVIIGFIESGNISTDGRRIYTTDSRINVSKFIGKCEEAGVEDRAQEIFDNFVSGLGKRR